MIFLEFIEQEDVDIKINMPWAQWVKYHQKKGTLPYSIGKYNSTANDGLALEMALAQQDAKNRIRDPIALAEIMSWTDEEFNQAYVEA